jgi:lipopolysaccharide heptosyltransferase II
MEPQLYNFYEELTNLTEFKVQSLDPHSLKNGIAVRVPNWLGDACMALPALMQLKQIIPEYCGLFIICPPAVAPLFRSLPMVNAVAELHQAHTKWNEYDIATIRQFRAGAVILFNNSLRDVLQLRKCGLNKRMYGAAARGRGIFLKRAFKFPKRQRYALNHDQHVARYLSMVHALGAPEWDGSLPEFKIAKPFAEMSESTQSLCSNKRLLTISSGAAYGRAKCWGTENFRLVAESWIEDGGIVVVTGTAKDRDDSNELIKGLPEQQAFNVAGETDIYDLMHLLQNSAATLANDSGVMHLSAALGEKGVAIFGSTDPSWTAPISNKWKLILSGEDCGPCFKRVCPNNDYKCMASISTEIVIATLKTLNY